MDNTTIVQHLHEIRLAKVGVLSGVHERALREAADALIQQNVIHITDSSGEEIAVIDGSLADFVVKEGVKQYITTALERLIAESE